jgi:colanic acid biosynthesis glycosyl transferase WcaI
MGMHNVIFLPVQPYNRLGELLATADVAVIPQKPGVNDIVLPSKLSNIMASQRPVVVAASADSELGRIVNESGGGLVVSQEDPAQLAQTILHLHRSPDICIKLAINGRRYMENHLAHRAILGAFRNRLTVSLSVA